jgi:hypothetical protein
MKDYKEYLKNKSKGIRGAATLEPPQGDNGFQSVASMAVLDLISEGPIYGLVDANGKKTNNISILESLFLDDTPVLAKNVATIRTEPIKYGNIKMIGRCTSGNLAQAFLKIDSHLTSGESENVNNIYLSSVKKAELAADSGAFCQYVEDNPALGNYGFIQYSLSGIFPTGTNSEERIYSRVDIDQGGIGSYNLSVFNLDHYLTESGTNYSHLYKRSTRNSKNEVISIPSSINYGYQLFNNNKFSYSSSPERIDTAAGKVGKQYMIDGFCGGGIVFFHIGDNVAEDNNGNFLTGKFFIEKGSSNTRAAMESGITNKHDVFLFSNASDGGISLERPAPNQIDPEVGHCAGKMLEVGFTSDTNLTYNYNNIDFDFREGYETQPKMEGHSEGVQDFDIRKKLYGPLIYGTTDAQQASSGDGSGYTDIRSGGGADFSAWMLNPPLEADAYPYTHTIKRLDVKRCVPTVAVEQLGDTIPTGDDAGVQTAARLLVSFTQGFEGGVTGASNSTAIESLLSQGNSLQSIALGTFESKQEVRYSGIIVSNYLDTYSGINDLPRNRDLRTMTASDIPGISDSIIQGQGYGNSELLFPGEEWKVPNRFLRIQKESFETDSTLLQRECSISYVSEQIGEPFSYPLVALGGTIFDARNFATQPTRDFLVRGKLVAVPSNYNPLNADGKDKRFISNAANYGKRDIYRFNSNATVPHAIVFQDINLGTSNFQFKVKVRFGTVKTDSSTQTVFDTMGGTATANRLALYQTDNKIRCGTRDGNGIFKSTFVDISSYSNSDIFEISVLRVGNKITLTVKVGSTTVGTNSFTMTNSLNLNFLGGSRQFVIGGNANSTSTSVGLKISNNSKIVDLQIYKNNELKHHWDGTQSFSMRHSRQFTEKYAGYHATLNSEGNGDQTDTSFDFGRNKVNIYNGLWDGTFKLAWTDNPAWILYDLMINPIYGVGNAIDDREDINIFNLYQIARYCDAVDDDGFFDGLPDSTRGLEPRFSCNVRIFDSKNAFEVLGNIASVFRGFTFWDGVGLNFAIDRDKKISAIFNNGNVYDGLFNYGDITSTARFTKVEVLYADARDLYGSKSEYVEDEDAIRKYGLITKTLNGIGCTSKSQAKRMGKYILFSNRMETEIVQFRGGTDCLFLEPGDIIRIDDELKNFEPNYGKVLEIDDSSTEPYVSVESNINPNNIQLGANGGVYLYTNREQTELENLYDIVKFQTTYQFGENSDVYSGAVNSDFIDTQSFSEIQKIKVTGVSAQTNRIKLLLDTGDANIGNLTGVQTGSFSNIELTNNVDTTYKVVRKRQSDSNLYEIEAMEYNLDKFNKIEQDDFDDEEITYNIGIPAHTVTRPSSPSNVTFNTVQQTDTSYSVTGTITAAGGSNETSYRVVVYRTSQAGPYTQKEVARETDNTTDFACHGLVNGTYTVQVTSLRNPESSVPFESTFKIDTKTDVYLKPIIKNISIPNDDLGQYHRYGGYGIGHGQSKFEDVQYNFVTVNKKDEVFSLSQLDYTMDIYVLKESGKYVNLEFDYEQDIYVFDDVLNASIFSGVYNSGFNMRFDLKKDGVIVDTASYETFVI